MAWDSFNCDWCGKKVIRQRRYRPKAYQHKFCSCKCAAQWQVAHGIHSKGTSTGKTKQPGALPHTDCNIRITRKIDLFPDFQPEVGVKYRAERYVGYAGVKQIGYVIQVNGHRVNIRENECVEV